ncbi:hypothetical protein EYF80_005271 [Liparis tanakae]|uniref:Uncharacterized protein n=1 Tax=Liparis tanakae TaxID=230148 RepID=A0A4Z2J3Q5_9TELE|nr:hypothetical protein EYF80_005271 [Liparis tanakae]
MTSCIDELPSRWIQVRSSQVEGGDGLARVRKENLCVSQSIYLGYRFENARDDILFHKERD